MKGKYVQSGEYLDYANSSGSKIAAMTLLFIGTIAGIAATDISDGETGAVATKGVYSLDKDGAEITAGAKVYYDAANDRITASADNGESGDDLVNYAYTGVAIAAAAATDSTVLVRLNY